MKKTLLTLALLWSVAYGQFCADEDTVRSNSATQITATTARINGTTSHFTGSVVSLQLKYVRVGQTDTVTSSGTGALRNLTGLQPATQYVYYYKSICGSGSQSQTIGPYRFTTLANTILYVDERPTRFYHWKADSSMIVAQGDTVVGREPSTFPQIRYKTSDNTFYGYYPNCSCWRALAIDSAGIISLLNGKVDSVTVSGDSLFYWKQGVSYGYILPSLNNVWRNTGNSGIDTSVNWIGTNDNKDLVVKTNGSRRFTVNVNGALGIGNTPNYGTSGYLLQTNGSGSAVSWVDHSTLSTSISKISNAVASNTIDNSNHTQSWAWNSRTGVFAALNITSNSTALIGTFPILKISSTGSNVNSGKTATAAEFSSANTGTSSTNIGLITSASGATNNYGLLVTAGNVGIGTSTPSETLEVSGTIKGRWVPRVGSTTSSATPTINTDNVDIYKLTAQAADITSFTTNLSGTPRDGDILEIQITGTATRAITWGSSFVSSTVTLPTTTSGTATLTVILQYYTTSSYGNNKWTCVNYY